MSNWPSHVGLISRVGLHPLQMRLSWSMPEPRIIDGSPSGTSTVGLIQERILIANFPDVDEFGGDFMKPGRCPTSKTPRDLRRLFK